MFVTQIQIIDGYQLHGGNTLPITGSHEAVGIVSHVGPDVHDFKIGDRVGTLNYYHPCGMSLMKQTDEGNVLIVSMTMRGMFIVNGIKRLWD